MNKVLLGALVLLLVAGFTASASGDRNPSPSPPPEKPVVQGTEEYGIKDLQVKFVLPGPIENPNPPVEPLGGPDGGAPRRGIAGLSGSLQAAGSGGAAAQAVAVERSLRRLTRDLR